MRADLSAGKRAERRARTPAPSGGGLEALAWRVWRRRGWAACMLWPLSLVFGAVVWLRRRAYALGVFRRWRAPVPVVIVGNLCVGGTGKTPVTIAVAQCLARAGWRPAVLTRGYRAGAHAPRRADAAGDAEAFGDEALLLARALPGIAVWVGRDRAAVARQALAATPRPDVLIADDGLQHHALARDVEIVLRDARAHGNGWLLPAGPMREPPGRRGDLELDTPRLVLGDAWQLADPARRQPLADLAAAAATARAAGHPALAAAGIGQPEKFFASLRGVGIDADTLGLPDHYAYRDDPFAGRRATLILITEKDAVKCAAHPVLGRDERIWVVPAQAEIDPAWCDALLRMVNPEHETKRDGQPAT